MDTQQLDAHRPLHREDARRSSGRRSRVQTGRSVREAPSDGREGLAGPVLDDDELFHLLQSERRRRAIRYLLAADAEPIVLGDVAEAVAAEEYDTTVDRLRSEDRQRVYITLYQSHLPQLADAGVVTFDRDQGEITPAPLVEEFEQYLSTDGPGDEPGAATWAWLTLASAGLGALTTLALLATGGVAVMVGAVLAVTTALLAVRGGSWLRTP